jgi:hypothetical protein
MGTDSLPAEPANQSRSLVRDTGSAEDPNVMLIKNGNVHWI